MMNNKKQPNYKLATVRAHEVIDEFNINEFPVDLNNIISQIPNLKVYSYKWLSNITNYSIEKIEDMFESGSIVKNINNKYLIFYNNNDNRGRIRFTIAHELGHYFLNHTEHNDINEKEADCFARNLLCPISLLNLQSPFIDDFIYLSNLCDISYSAAMVRINLMKNDVYYSNFTNTLLEIV
ncbi:MAG: ImmA/IrrE family metallo-endopeptidase [Lachnospirales bacterium]